MEKMNITINGKALSAMPGSTILEAAEANDIHIPTLCTLKKLDPRANCRICVVEVEGKRTFEPACATKITEGMVVATDTPAIRASRKNTLELILSRHAVDCHHCLRIGSSKCDDLDPYFCEMCFFCDCERDGICELQTLAREYKVDAIPYEIDAYRYEIDDSTKSVIRNPNKCVKCRRCVDVCCEVQTVNALSVINRGADIQVMPEMGKALIDSPCVQCGRCVSVCPTGAIYEREKKDELLYYAHKYGVTTVAQISPDMLEELAELFKMEPEELDIRVVAAGLKKIGVDYVVDDRFAVAKAKTQAVERLEGYLKSMEQPIILSNSYSAIQFLNKQFPGLSGQLVAYPSTQQAFGAYVKDVWAKDRQIDPANVRTISITSTNENEAEAVKNGSVDYVLNARELYRIFLRTGANPKKLPPIELDNLGFVADANSELENLLAPVTWKIGGEIVEMDLPGGNRAIKAVVGNTLGHARELLAQVERGQSVYHVVKISS